MKRKKKLGVGSLSLLLLICGLLFSISFYNKPAIGDLLLTFFGLSPWSNGDSGIHYTVFYSLIFFIPASIIGYTFRHDWGAKIGRMISTILSASIIFTIFFLVI